MDAQGRIAVNEQRVHLPAAAGGDAGDDQRLV
jgi:hypothetical protein